MRILSIICFILFNISIANAQIIKGNISNVSGEPIQYSSVYIEELKQGTVANTGGDYEIRLPPGTYNVYYQSLGYVPETKKVTIINKDTVNLNVALQLQYYEIPEIRITSSGEDPAYSIMRKAIGFAPYFLNQVKSYTADVYLKGNLNVIKIPKLLQKSMKIDANNTKIKAGDSFMMESVNEIGFTAPDNYVQRVISFNSTFPSEGNEISPMDFIRASFYEPVIAGMAVSPLSPEAFFHYTFKYEGSTPQGDYLVDKISVIPKRKSQQLFSGTIYIIEDLWCLQSIDLTNHNLAGTVKIEQLYVAVQGDIWLPISHNFEINLEIIGLRADAGYGSSVKYRDVTLNPAIPKPDSVTSETVTKPILKTDTVKTKNSEEINKLLSKDELSNREMVKLSRLMAKETAVKDTANDLEIKRNTIQTTDKDARLKDSAYWANIRPIPLTETDIKSLNAVRNNFSKEIRADSLSAGRRRRNTLSIGFNNNQNDTLQQTAGDSLSAPKKKKSAFMQSLKDIGFGKTWSDKNNFSFRYGGLLNLDKLRFNTVDGFVYGIDFRINKTWKNNNNLSVYPELRWAFSREKLMWSINSTYSYDRLKQKQFYFRLGITGSDFNKSGGINPFINSLTSLFLEKNYLKLYESRYITLGHEFEIVNGLYLNINSTFEKREVLFNTTGFSFIKTGKGYTDNTPVNQYLSDPLHTTYYPGDNRHGNLSATFTYTPRQRYSIRNERKIPAGSEYPTFSISWKHGINKFREDSVAGNGYKHYDFLKAEAYNNKNIGAFSEYRWLLRTGFFLNNKWITFQDFNHFNSQPFPVMINNYRDAFMLPKFYSLSTPEFFIEGHFKYTSPYLLLKLLPVISNTLTRENLSLSYLYTNHSGSYTEIGYSMSEILFLAEIGVYTGFKNTKYNSTGVKLILRFN
jgi:hypothetical protein